MKIQKMLGTSMLFTVLSVGMFAGCVENNDYDCQTKQRGGGPPRSADCVQDPSTGVKKKATR